MVISSAAGDLVLRSSSSTLTSPGYLQIYDDSSTTSAAAGAGSSSSSSSGVDGVGGGDPEDAMLQQQPSQAAWLATLKQGGQLKLEQVRLVLLSKVLNKSF